MSFSDVRTVHWVWLLSAVCVTGLAWAGSLDRLAGSYVSASLLDAGIIYGTARAINALVSALQGTELDMWLVTFSIGEVLDPVNDVIERFSAVMTVAIVSLVIQQLLLAVVSHTSFTVLLTAVGAAAVLAFLVGRTVGFRVLSRAFLLIALLRFALALVIAANLWVDRVFLPDSNSREHAVMRDFYSDLDNVRETVRGEGGSRGDVAGQFDRLQDKFDAFVDGTLSLLGSVLLKSVIVPVVFLYGVLVVARRWLFAARMAP